MDKRTIGPFQGEYRWLSNFYPCTVYLAGLCYPSVEHAYQAAKTKVKSERAQIQKALTPARAKRLGRNVHLRWDWEDVKMREMENLLRQKFLHPETDLTQRLIETGNSRLVEFNTWHDNFWGICTCPRCSNMTLVRSNNLGILLMRIRADLQEK